MRGRFRLPLWGKFLSGSLVIAGLVGAATAAGLAIDSNDADSSCCEVPEPPHGPPKAGRPQTILVIGAEPRSPNGNRFGEARLVMLVRLDSRREQIRILSLPPSLTTSLARFRTMTIAQAHAAAGPKAVLEMVKELTGLDVNHLVDVDSNGFVRIVNGLGCVYVDVDRPLQLPVATASAPGGSLGAGYQRMCGATAVQYALFAGEGNETLQESRQQQLLAAIAPRGGVWSDRKKLVGLFTRHATSDVSSVSTALQVIGLLIGLQRAPVESVPLRMRSPMGRTVSRFLAPQEPSGKEKPSGSGRSRLSHLRLEPSSLQSLNRLSRLPKLYPSVVPEGWASEPPRVYKLDGTGDASPPAGERSSYRWAFRGPAEGDYAGFQATAWRNPPMLNNPSAVMTKRGRTYKLFYDGGRLRTVGWQTPEGSFWVSNSLDESISVRQMLGIADGMRKPRGKGA